MKDQTEFNIDGPKLPRQRCPPSKLQIMILKKSNLPKDVECYYLKLGKGMFENFLKLDSMARVVVQCIFKAIERVALNINNEGDISKIKYLYTDINIDKLTKYRNFLK